MKYPLLFAFSVGGILAVFYFSWLPNPNLTESGLLPAWISQWTDQDANMNLRTAVPFTFLGLLGSVWLILSRRRLRWWFVCWLLLALLVMVAELGQLMIPRRNFDWGDIMWGCIGALVSMGPIGLGWFTILRKKASPLFY